MNVPEKLINFRVYQNGNDLIGIADVTLPNLEAMTETIKGAGLAGEIDSPVLGHYGSQTLELNWRVLYKPAVLLAAPKAVTLDLRGANQVKDSETGEFVVLPVKVVARGVPKSTELGKLDVGTTSDTKTTLEVDYTKVTVDGKDILELDKYNYICKVDDTDYLSEVREALGL